MSGAAGTRATKDKEAEKAAHLEEEVYCMEEENGERNGVILHLIKPNQLSVLPPDVIWLWSSRHPLGTLKTLNEQTRTNMSAMVCNRSRLGKISRHYGVAMVYAVSALVFARPSKYL